MIPGNSDWTEYSIVFDVPVSSSVLFYGAFVQNAGTLWMDDVHLSIVDASTRLTGVPVTAGQGKITLAIDRAHVLSMPENLDFEETVTSDDRIWWQEVIQPNFR